MSSIFYIRFLKGPPTAVTVGQLFSVVWTATNDLGELHFSESLMATCSVESDDPGWHIVAEGCSTRHDRNTKEHSVKLVYRPFESGTGIMKTTLIVQHAAGRSCGRIQIKFAAEGKNETHAVWQDAVHRDSHGWIIPMWSLPIDIANHGHMDDASRELERRVLLKDGISLPFREDTGESIGGHVWSVSNDGTLSFVGPHV